MKRIEFYTFCPQGTGLGFYPARSIFAIDNENLIISSGSQVAYIKNGKQVKKECVPISINKLWGSKSNDLYAVGYNDNIAHWDGVRWGKIESGTDVDFKDIYGIPDGKEVWACGWKENNGNIVLLEIKNHKSNILWNNFNPNPYY